MFTILCCACVVPENIHTPPTEGIANFWAGGFQKTKKFKEMYGVELEFPDGWGLLSEIPSVG